jgi:AcrR family transcriptional regulator
LRSVLPGRNQLSSSLAAFTIGVASGNLPRDPALFCAAGGTLAAIAGCAAVDEDDEEPPHAVSETRAQGLLQRHTVQLAQNELHARREGGFFLPNHRRHPRIIVPPRFGYPTEPAEQRTLLKRQVRGGDPDKTASMSTTPSVPETVDPRVRRTRRALHQALETLLERHDFDTISVQDIAEEAELNRATFYAHYPDKFALLESMVEARFNRMVEERGIAYDGCEAAFNGMVLGVCDFLASTPRLESERARQIEPQLESAVVGAVRKLLLLGLDRHGTRGPCSPELVAAAASWAIFGAAKEWVLTPGRGPSEEIAPKIVTLVKPIFAAIASAEDGSAGIRASA